MSAKGQWGQEQDFSTKASVPTRLDFSRYVFWLKFEKTPVQCTCFNITGIDV
jgi:hypothetical protein